MKIIVDSKKMNNFLLLSTNIRFSIREQSLVNNEQNNRQFAKEIIDNIVKVIDESLIKNWSTKSSTVSNQHKNITTW